MLNNKENIILNKDSEEISEVDEFDASFFANNPSIHRT